MKKSFKIIACCLVLCLMLVGCGSKKKDSKKDNGETNKNTNTNGEEIILKLASNPSTGYTWTYEITGDDAIAMSYSYEDNCAEGMVGCSGNEVYVVKATAPGFVTLSFKYSRPWEENQDVSELTAIYELVIDENLSITETHSGTYFEPYFEQ